MSARDKPNRALWWSAVAAAAAVGFALRIAAAQGGFWTDEAWSMIYAHDARDAAGVFLRINHDNNHHLYSLWLQAVGLHAPAWLARLPAILAGTLCVPLAALVVGRRALWAGPVAALLFAVSPTMVNFGSEARGYSLMLLAALATLWRTGEALEGHERPGAPWCLALIAAFGMFSQMTFAAPVALVALWIYLDRRAALGPAAAIRETAQLIGPALAVTAGVVAFVFAAAAASPTGMRLGGYQPFDWRDFIAALNDLTGWTAGLTLVRDWVAPLGLASVAIWVGLRPPRWLGSRARLYAILILGVPVGVALLRVGNSGFARYYLASALGLILLGSEWIGRGFARQGAARAGAAALLGTFLLTGLWRDSQLLELKRGRPEEAVALIAERSQPGVRVALDPDRLEGALVLAALRRGFAVEVAKGCAPADYLLAAQRRWTATPAVITHCGVKMRAIDSTLTSSLSGEAWVLYGAEPLQTAGAPDSGPPPGGAKRRLFSRAGVAQG